MKRRLVVATVLAALAAGVYLTVASAHQTPFSGTYEQNFRQPTAGTVFTAEAIYDSSTTFALYDRCHYATIGNRNLAPVRSAFWGSVGRNVIVCAYRIPAATAGRTLRLKTPVSPGYFTWTVRP